MRSNASIFFVLFFLTMGLSFDAAHAAWLDDVQEGIRTAEYHVTFQDGRYQAPNRAQGFRTSFTEEGVLLVPRVERSGMDWTWGLTWVAYGRGSQSWPVEALTLSVQGSRVDYRRGAFTEWYENGPRGLKQGFLLPSPPGDGPLGAGEMLHVDLALSGDLAPILADDRQVIDFVDGKGARVLRYAELVVTDAGGDTLAAWMEGFTREGVRGVRLVVDAHGARFPLTVDPLATSSVWTVEGDQEQALLGTSVATAGDVNGDGYSDVIVGAPSFDGGLADQGRVYLFLGSPAGPAATPAWTLDLPQAGAQLGMSVACAGDVNGDGYADVIVGAPGLDFQHTDEGAAAVYFGSSTGLPAESNWGVAGGQAGAQFGRSVAGAGDVDGDGYGDILVGAPSQDNGNLDEGRVSLYRGSPDGPLLDAAWTTEGNADNVFLGLSAATAGDVNGDGYADVIVGVFGHGGQAGRAVVHHGSAGGLGATAAWLFTGTGTEQLGVSVATAGDVNGDGYADVIVGAQGYANGNAFEGRALVFHGSAAGLALAPNWAIEGNGENASLGFSVGTAGDVDGDGYADVIVGAHHHREPGQFSNGRAEVYRGSPTGLATTFLWRVVGAAETRFGASVGTAGDVNGDGYADVIVGAPHHGGGQFREGRASVFLGSAAHLSTTPGWLLDGAANGDRVDGPRAAGDVNGDGYDDALREDDDLVHFYPGSPAGLAPTPASTLDPTLFPGAQSPAGDVNGDGYGDLIVGQGFPAPLPGQAQVYLGTPTGWATSAVWTVSGASGALLGRAVSSAGDVNGDGYGDVIVGEPGHDRAFDQTDSGRVFLYLGSPSGPSTTPNAILEPGPQFPFAPGPQFGIALAAAGDVNGDGYGDVVVGAPRHHNADGELEVGRVFVYAGAPNGSLSLIKTLGPGLDVQGGRLGWSVAGAGDVNGDGYADVLAGAPDYSTAPGDHGRAFVFLGDPVTLPSMPAWTFAGTQQFGRLGFSVGPAGDVNGDGHADIVVAEPFYTNGQDQEGRAHLFLGSATGAGTGAVWTLEGNTVQANMGALSLGTLGDVNGDGYADLAVGAPGYNNGRGRAHVFYGNGGAGVSLHPVQRRADDSGPIPRLGSAAANAFRVGLLGKTAFGRGKVQLEAELKPLGTPFDGQGTLVGPETNTGTGGEPLQVLAEDLVQLVGYTWRVRLRHDSASSPLAPPASRWITLPWGGWREAELRTGASTGAGRASGLTLIKVGLGVTAVWLGAGSCLEEDSHAIYEGTLGDFTSHVPVTCDAPTNSWNFTPLGGNRYFLLVPRKGAVEGSYGLRSNGTERPASTQACLPQQVQACP